MCYEQKEVRNRGAAEVQGLGSSEEDECRVEDAAINANNGPVGTIQVHDGFQISQQQPPQGSVISWERFLPIRSLKVLLVENDDSTRHVVSALLRNCSYEVNAVANGLQAWKILEDLTNHIDIVLTEVVMPVLSGIGLLWKIMTHKTRKNIPVIMMSSQDSMGIVFKCLSKGAVDFLVKPIRKNELKNLWQHVWRRCHSSSGSGSESGTQTKESAKSKSNDDSENESNSADEHENGSNGLSVRNGSDNGSDTQSSRTKKAAEVDSPQHISPLYQLADAPGSTCAQGIHTKSESFSNGWVHVAETNDGHEQDEQQDDVTMGKDLEIQISKNADLKCECQCEKLSTLQTNKKQSKLPEVDSKPFNYRQLELDNENIRDKWRDLVPGIITANTSCTNPQAESRDFDSPSGPSDISRVKETASLELTLKRMRGAEDDRSAANEDCNILRHSDCSAFSKYNTVSSANQFHLKQKSQRQQSNGSSDNNDMASSAKYATSKSEALNDKSESMSTLKPFHSSAFQALQNGHICSSQQTLPEKTDDMGLNSVQSQLRGSHHLVQVHNHHHHHHHYHQHDHNIQLHQSPLDHDDLPFKNVAAVAPQCGSSNVFGSTNEVNVGNYSVTALNAGQTNLDSDNGATGNSVVGGITGRISGNVVDEGQVAQREAALTKFRQKRKERCLERGSNIKAGKNWQNKGLVSADNLFNKQCRKQNPEKIAGAMTEANSGDNLR